MKVELVFVCLLVVVVYCMKELPVKYPSTDFEIIDVDISKHRNPSSRYIRNEGLSEEERGLLKKVLRRLYEHVCFVDNRYVLNIANGKEIGISETLFQHYKAEFERLNKLADEYEEANPGKKVTIGSLKMD